MKIYLLLLILLPLINFSQSKSDIYGMWQSSGVLAAGWDDTFYFKDDGTFIFFFNQMDCSNRNVSYMGYWEFKNSKIYFTIMKREVLEGGYFTLSDSSCGSDSMLVDGRLQRTSVIPYEFEEYSIHNVKTENEREVERKTMYIGKTKY